ncbi:hypothetical protein MMC14_009803 [Varicellaria rhodocarpa]|nr:hypothetical protein [Varicellaria rhodocarpa]
MYSLEIAVLTIHRFGNIRNCSLRSSPTPSLNEEDIQLETEWSWETLIKIGGRPTRQILYDTARETKIVDGYIYFRDEDGCEHGTYEHDYSCLHWCLERGQFNDELNDWKEFRKDQLRIHEKQRMNRATQNGEPQHLERRPHAFTLEELKISELDWDRHEQELKEWKESCDAERRAQQNQQGKRVDEDVNPQSQEHE